MARHDLTRSDDIALQLKSRIQRSWNYAKGPGRQRATLLGLRALHRIKINLTPRRLLSFPHLLVAFWIIILLWGERWIFDSRVDSCDWDHWEDWVCLLSPD